MLVESNTFNCPAELDLDLSLTASGNTLTGTAVTHLRTVNQATCTDVFGQTANYGLLDGTINGKTVSFTLGGAYRMTGTIDNDRMTGTFAHIEIDATGRFALTRQ